MGTEPTRVIGYLTAAATAIIGLLIAFGANISDDQRNAILTAIAASAPVVVFIVEYTRSKVMPTGTAAKKIDQAYQATPGIDPKPKV